MRQVVCSFLHYLVWRDRTHDCTRHSWETWHHFISISMHSNLNGYWHLYGTDRGDGTKIFVNLKVFLLNPYVIQGYALFRGLFLSLSIASQDIIHLVHSVGSMCYTQLYLQSTDGFTTVCLLWSSVYSSMDWDQLMVLNQWHQFVMSSTCCSYYFR